MIFELVTVRQQISTSIMYVVHDKLCLEFSTMAMRYLETRNFDCDLPLIEELPAFLATFAKHHSRRGSGWGRMRRSGNGP